MTKHIESTVPLAIRLASALERDLERLRQQVGWENGGKEIVTALLSMEVVALRIQQGLEKAGITE